MADHAHCYSEQIFTTARQLLEHLNPLETERWIPGEYIFRGQLDAELGLVPSAHRYKGDVTAARFWGNQDFTSDKQIEFEKAVIRAFLQACDKSGLAVPKDSRQLREQLEPLHELIGSTSNWPQQDMHEILAFAQHHGVPTCLLDWTHHPYVAAYFAASSALAGIRDDIQEISGDLAIWALHKSCEQIEFVEAPGGTSPYLAAQSGLFTVTRLSGKGDDVFYERPLEKEAYRCTRPFHLQCFTLPKSEAGDLLKGCNLLGVTGSTLFPGYEGIAKSVRDWARIQHKWPGAFEDSTRALLR